MPAVRQGKYKLYMHLGSCDPVCIIASEKILLYKISISDFCCSGFLTKLDLCMHVCVSKIAV